MMEEEGMLINFIKTNTHLVHPNVMSIVRRKDMEGIRMALNHINYGLIKEARDAKVEAAKKISIKEIKMYRSNGHVSKAKKTIKKHKQILGPERSRRNGTQNIWPNAFKILFQLSREKSSMLMTLRMDYSLVRSRGQEVRRLMIPGLNLILLRVKSIW